MGEGGGGVVNKWGDLDPSANYGTMVDLWRYRATSRERNFSTNQGCNFL